MENRVEKSEDVLIRKNTKSLDLQSLYVEKTKISDGGKGAARQGSSLEGRGVKRVRGSSLKSKWGAYAQLGKRKKGRKELPLSTFDRCIGSSKEGEGDSRGPQSFVDAKERGLTLNGLVLEDKRLNVKEHKLVPGEGKVQDSVSLRNITPQSLDDTNGVVVPKRPRGTFGRKKLELGSSHVSKPAISTGSKRVTSLSNSSGKDNSRIQKPKLSYGKFKHKKILDQFAYSGIGKSVPRLVSKEVEATVKLSGASVSEAASGGTLRNPRKRRKRLAENQTFKHSVGGSSKTFQESEDDDEENLEQNAARMLSSRFDPRCTGFFSDASESPSQPANGTSFCSFEKRRGSSSDGVAGRVLRPRNQKRLKGIVRKRRHFYELNVGDLDPYWVIGKRIKVYWPLDQSWYFGLVKDYEPVHKLHHIKYDDRDEEWINLQNERFKILLLPAEKSALEGKSRNANRDPLRTDDNGANGFMDSEPIISWLSRSNQRVKPPSLKKRNSSFLQPATLSENFCGTSERCLDPSLADIHGKFSETSWGSLIGGKRAEKSAGCSKATIVYYRRRFRRGEQNQSAIPGHNSACVRLSVDDPTSECGGHVQYFTIEDFRHSKDSAWWDGESFDSLNLSLALIKSEPVIFEMSVPLSQLFMFAFSAKFFLPRTIFLLPHYGTIMMLWPKVRLEMLFVDSIVGLKFLLFEGCLNKAVSFVCFILNIFNMPDEVGKQVHLQLPVTALRFNLSGFDSLGRELVFVFYNFFEVKSSKWLYLDNKLKHHCQITMELPLSQCTYGNHVTVSGGKDQCSDISFSGKVVSPERRSGPAIAHLNCSSHHHGEKFGRLSPFVLSFAAAPDLFRSLRLKLLMENVASLSFSNSDGTSLEEGPDNSCLSGDRDCDSLENLPSHLAGIMHDKRAGHATNSEDGWVQSHNSLPKSELSARRAAAVQLGSGNCKRSFHDAHMCHCVPGVHLPERHDSGCLACINTISAPHHHDEDTSFFGETSDARQSPRDLACSIHSPNPTGPRSAWHRNRHGSASSSGYRSKHWPDGGADFFRCGLVNGTQKPRSQVSYLLPFGEFDFGPKPRSHHRRGRPYKRIKNDNLRWTGGGPGSPERLETMSCDANILVIDGDRGRRECSALVVLDSVDHKDWRLLVKFSGVTRFSYKAHQFFQPGTTNRYTHAMMWKGGKDWILEFTDRSQWNLFKEMHEECYNRNVQAASVKNIPIPGVRLIEDTDDNTVELPYVQNTPIYYRQLGTEVDVALDPSRVIYDLDSDDEEWISKMTNPCDVAGSELEISHEGFEKAMDMFEKVSYKRQQDNFTDDEIEQFMAGTGPMDVIKAIHEHWQHKRRRKGIPLIRQFQPALWELYQQQLKDWELARSKVSSSANGLCENARQKPPMFAFCLRPRGLEVPNKGSKQRSQRKLSAHNGAFSRDQDGYPSFGRKLNGVSSGQEKSFTSYQNYESDSSLWHESSMKCSPRDIPASGLISMGNGGSEKYQFPRLNRTKSKKTGMYMSHVDPMVVGGMSYGQRFAAKRNGVSRWNTGLPDWPSVRQQYQPDGFLQRQRAEQMGGLDYDEFRLRDASSAAQHATNMAKLKREKAQRLLHRAEIALHKAVVALMTAEAIKDSEKDVIDDG